MYVSLKVCTVGNNSCDMIYSSHNNNTTYTLLQLCGNAGMGQVMEASYKTAYSYTADNRDYTWPCDPYII